MPGTGNALDDPAAHLVEFDLDDLDDLDDDYDTDDIDDDLD